MDEGAGAVEADAEVLEGLVGVGPAAGVDVGVALDEVAEAAADRGREGVEELVDVDRGRGRGEAERGAFVQRRVAVRAGADRDVVVGDAGERGGADRRRGALVQLLFDADLDLGEVVVGQLDAFDRADRLAADQHLVVGHELARVLEEEVVLVFAAAAEDHDRERDHHHRERRDHRDSGGGDSPALCRTFFLACGIGSHGFVACGSPASDPGERRANRIRAIRCHARGEQGLNWNSTRYSGPAARLVEVGGASPKPKEERKPMRKRLTSAVAIAVAVAVTAAGVAGAVQSPVLNGADGNTQSIAVKITPQKLSKKRPTPVTLDVTTATTTTNPSANNGVPIPAVRGDHRLSPRASSIFSKGYPTCDASAAAEHLDRSGAGSLQKSEDRQRRRHGRPRRRDQSLPGGDDDHGLQRRAHRAASR